MTTTLSIKNDHGHAVTIERQPVGPDPKQSAFLGRLEPGATVENITVWRDVELVIRECTTPPHDDSPG
jgi:hypothetical protein